MDQSKAGSQGNIVPPRQFPYCIVWTPIPLISWLLPFVGHMGVCSSKGIIMVSQGCHTVSLKVSDGCSNLGRRAGLTECRTLLGHI